MRNLMMALAAIASAGSATTAQAQWRWVIGNALRGTGVPGGNYHSGKRIRVFVAFDFGRLSSPEELLIAKAASMASAKGFARIGVNKSRCITAVALGTPRSTACYLLATMLDDAGAAMLEGKGPVRYYDVAAILAGGPSLLSASVGLGISREPAAPTPVPGPSPVARPLPPGRPRTVAPLPQRSAAEIERARLQAAVASGGDGVIVQ